MKSFWYKKQKAKYNFNKVNYTGYYRTKDAFIPPNSVYPKSAECG